MWNFDTTEIKTYDELKALLTKSAVSYDLNSIRKAYEYSNNVHNGQKRLSGEDYITHCLTVAKYTVQINLDTTSVVAALLHDVVDKGGKNIEEIDHLFGTEVAFIIDGVTNIREYSKKYVGVDDNDVENFKHLIFNSVEDIRVLILRIVEKVHNIQSMSVLMDEKQMLSAARLLRVYAPLAEYLGLTVFQQMLQDKAFEILRPDEYIITKEGIHDIFSQSEALIENFTNDVTKILSEHKIKHEYVSGRKKGLFSAYLKCKRKYLDPGEEYNTNLFRSLKDFYAFRIIVEKVEDCYLVLGLLHSKWEYSEEDFDDYISKPKPNGYKSIHTVINYQGTDVEVQIRTKEMHEMNEFGAASHIAYKLQSSGSPTRGEHTWTKDLVKWQENKKLTKEDFKIKLFSESVFVFTPKGLVVRLDNGSTPLDFAYDLHTDIGNHFGGAKVNGKMVSMSYQLQTGDVVEILTLKKVNVNRDWLQHAKMTYTRRKIRNGLKKVA